MLATEETARDVQEPVSCGVHAIHGLNGLADVQRCAYDKLNNIKAGCAQQPEPFTAQINEQMHLKGNLYEHHNDVFCRWLVSADGVPSQYIRMCQAMVSLGRHWA